jgi:hypothetical protein
MAYPDKEYKQFLYIALGSLAEPETQIILSEKLDYLKNEQSKDVQANINELTKEFISMKTSDHKIPPTLPFPKGGITLLWKRGARGDFLKIVRLLPN